MSKMEYSKKKKKLKANASKIFFFLLKNKLNKIFI